MNALKLSKSRFHFLLSSILLFGTIIRLLGVSPGFNQFHSDEGISYSAAVSMLRNSNFDPLRYDYPALVPEINWLSFRFLFTPYYWVKYYVHNAPAMLDGYVPVIPKSIDINRIFQNDILGNREISALFWGRYTTAIISSASILLVYILASRLFSRQVGYLAAIFLALNFRSVTNSHLGLPDTYNAFFLLFSLVASWGLHKVPTRARYIFAGIAVGLSLGTKYQVFAIFPFLVSHLNRYWDSKHKLNVVRAFFDRKIFIAGCTALLTFIFLNPYLLINFDFATYSIHEVSLKYAMGKNAISLFPVHYWIFNDYGFPLFMLIIAGVLAMLLKARIQSTFLLSVIVPFLFVMLFYSNGGFYVRNFITISPLFLIYAAWLVVTLYKFLSKYSQLVARIAAGAVLSYVLYFPIGNIIIHTQEYQRPWNYQSIVDSTRAVLPQNAIVVGHPFDPLPSDLNIKRVSINAASLYSLQEFRTVKADFALINMDWAADPFYGWMTSTGKESLSYVLNKPYQQMRETYWGLTIEEMMRYVVVSQYKPWQAPEADLFLVKIPNVSNLSFEKPSGININDSWKVVNKEDSSDTFITVNNNSIEVGPGSGKFQITRSVSTNFDVKEGFVYKVAGYLVSEPGFANEIPNVFLRMDFYDTNNQHLLASVSDRFIGKQGSIEIVSQAPAHAKYASISVQASKALSGKVILKKLESSISTSQFPPTESPLTFEDYKDLLYPNSHGNL